MSMEGTSLLPTEGVIFNLRPSNLSVVFSDLYCDLLAAVQATANAGRGCGHVFFAEFSVPDDDGLKIVSGGVRNVKFWTVKGRYIKRSKAFAFDRFHP